MTAARWAVLAWALSFPTVMTWLYFTQPGPATSLVYTVGKVLQFGLPLLWWVIVDRSRLRPVRPRLHGLLTGILFGLVTGAAIVVLYLTWFQSHPAIHLLINEARERLIAFDLNSASRFLLFAVFLSLVHAILEEYYWRAFVFAELRAVVPLSWAIAISSIGFMAHHVVVLSVYFPRWFWSMAVPFSVGVAVGGAIWAWMYHRFGSIYPIWLSHGIVDAALMLVGYLLLFG